MSRCRRESAAKAAMGLRPRTASLKQTAYWGRTAVRYRTGVERISPTIRRCSSQDRLPSGLAAVWSTRGAVSKQVFASWAFLLCARERGVYRHLRHVSVREHVAWQAVIKNLPPAARIKENQD